MAAKKSFEQWLKDVDVAIAIKVGSRIPISHRDLPDVNYLDWYSDGVSAKAAAARAVKYAKEN